MNQSPFQFRWKKVLKWLLIAFPVVFVGTGIGVYGLHHIRIALAGGYWCIVVSPEGEMVSYYGEQNCDRTQEQNP